jgi:hypothetical protein
VKHKCPHTRQIPKAAVIIRLINWLFIVSRPPQKYIWKHHNYRWRAANFRSMLSAQGLKMSREGSLLCHTCCDTGLGFCGLIQRTTPFSRLIVRHTRGCGESILTRILMGPHSVAFYNTQGLWRSYFEPDPHGPRHRQKSRSKSRCQNLRYQ